MNGRLMAIGKAKSRQKFEIFEIDNKTDVEAEKKMWSLVLPYQSALVNSFF
jgi:hypothetical protein